MARETQADIVVGVPVEVAYRAWSDFESFPRFMNHVKEVRRVDASGQRIHWKASVGGTPQEWDAEVIDLTPNQRVAWRSVSGTANDGAVEFEPQGTNTRVLVRLNYDPPAGVAGDTADALFQATARAVADDLRNFKQLIETGKVSGGGLPWPAWLGIGLGGSAILAGIVLGAWYGMKQNQTSRTRANKNANKQMRRAARTFQWNVIRGASQGAAKGAARGVAQAMRTQSKFPSAWNWNLAQIRGAQRTVKGSANIQPRILSWDAVKARTGRTGTRG